MALAFAFSEPLLGGAGFDANTDFKRPILHLNESSPSNTSRKQLLPKFAFLSAEDLSGDSGYYGSTVNDSRTGSPDTKV